MDRFVLICLYTFVIYRKPVVRLPELIWSSIASLHPLLVLHSKAVHGNLIVIFSDF